MTPTPLDAATRLRMQRQRQRGTKPELLLRRSSHALGLRYRVDAKLPLTTLRRRADMLFTRQRVAVFVDGCFWHCCPIHGTKPKNNEDWWAEKLRANVERDRHTDELLHAAGWTAVRIWEHEDMSAAATRLREMIKPSTS